MNEPSPENMNALQGPVLGGDEQLEHPVRVTDDLPAGQLPIAGDAHLEGHLGPSEVVLGIPDARAGHLRRGGRDRVSVACGDLDGAGAARSPSLPARTAPW